MSGIEERVQAELFALADVGYRDFHSKLIPTINPDVIIGVRTPQLRKLAKSLAKEPDIAAFLQILPHRYYEENNLHGFLIESCKDYPQTIAYLDAFLPYVDNWATCDMMSPKIFRKHLPELIEKIPQWLASGETYTVRFGIGMLMGFYLDEAFVPEYLDMVANVKSEEYYINMMRAWYFATALAKQYDATLPYIQQQRLDQWTHNKSIQKSIESYRITDEQKTYLRTLKRK